MNSELLSQIFSSFILFPAVVGAFRFRKITSSDRPFFYLIWFGLLGEILGEVSRVVYRNTAPVFNIYVLIEAFFIILMFYCWKKEYKKEVKFSWICIFILLVWIIDNLIVHNLSLTNSTFRIVSSFLFIFLASDEIGLLISTERDNLLKNARFLVSVGIITFYCYKAFYETFFLITKAFSDPFQIGVLSIMDYVNLFVNLVFGLASLWISTRRKFTLPY